MDVSQDLIFIISCCINSKLLFYFQINDDQKIDSCNFKILKFGNLHHCRN